MEILFLIVIFAGSGFVAGYCLCHIATWAKVHKQESNIRALANDIAVMKEMEGGVPAEWVVDQLESMVTSEVFR